MRNDMRAQSRQTIEDRISVATHQTPIAVFRRPGCPRVLEACFASTVESARLIATDPTLLGVYCGREGIKAFREDLSDAGHVRQATA